MSLYTLLTAARGRQLLTERGWSEGLDFHAAECGSMLTVAGTVNTTVLIDLLPCLAARGRLASKSVSGLQLLCGKSGTTARIMGKVCGEEMSLNVVLIDMPDDHELCRDSLQNALQDDLATVCQLMAEDADTILALTGARYDGAWIFERETPHFIVAAEVWDELPVTVNPDRQQTDAWLDEILNQGSEVLSVGLVVIRDLGMYRMGEIQLPGVCVIRPGTPVRGWLPRQHLTTLAANVRRTIEIEREITASFAPR